MITQCRRETSARIRRPRRGRRVARAAHVLVAVCIAAGAPADATGQRVTTAGDERACCGLTVGGQAVSAVVWRGMEFTRSPALQPWVEIGWGAATLEGGGTWAVDGSWSEQDVTGSIAAVSRMGTAALIVSTHFYSSSERQPLPVTEAGVEYTTPGALPVRLLVTANLANDHDRAAQAELGVAHEWGRFGAELFGSVALDRSAYYEARAGDVLQFGAALTHELPPVAGIGVSLGGSAVHSPAHARSWLLARATVALPLRSDADRPPPAGAPPPRP